MNDTLFTKIIKGEIPCHKIYENDKVLAFLDVYPKMEGHTLVISKVQVDHIWDLDQVEYTALWDAVKVIGAHLKEVTGAERVGVVVEGFGVPHTHVHLIPIHNGEDLKRPQDLEAEPDHARLASLAEKLAL